ncbi:hypothetical protein [Absidia glauca]|uniref:C2H2-type domain-containing protein n=1 Tax=Absidia glauca TaxID=4829 RepID=A0A163J464_ABSGL|nr:hypothetical protein [Absidia glauca]
MDHDNFQKQADGDYHEFHDYVINYWDDDDELDVMTSQSASRASTPHPPTPQLSLSPGTQHFPTNPFWTVADCYLAHATSSAPTPAIASTTAIAIATVIASPESTASPTKIKIKQTAAGLKRSRMDDLDKTIGRERHFCPNCNQSFTRKQDLNRHGNSAHSNQLAYPCPSPGCTKRFARSDVMKRHLRNVH